MQSTVQSFDSEHIDGYHAHVYYNNQLERDIAAVIRTGVAERFEIELGRWREEPVGPHPLPMYQIAFENDVLPEILPWLMSVRGPLSILIHVRTHQNDLLDHMVGTLWLGPQLELNTAFFGDVVGRDA